MLFLGNVYLDFQMYAFLYDSPHYVSPADFDHPDLYSDLTRNHSHLFSSRFPYRPNLSLSQHTNPPHRPAYFFHLCGSFSGMSPE